MYQYAFTGDYQDDHYDGDVATKELVNNLIGEFESQDKFVTAICHGVTVLAWSRVDGVSPLNGRHVSVPFIGAPAVEYEGNWYGNYQLGQYEQVVANGAIANTASMQYGDPLTVVDDVVRDGKIITAEHYGAAATFGTVVAKAVLADLNETPVEIPNHPPAANDASFLLAENSPAGTIAGQVTAADPDVGQSITYAIASGNTGGAFSIDSATGLITVANAAILDFEVTPQFQLKVTATDNGTPAMVDIASVTISLQNIIENLSAGIHHSDDDLIVQGTSGSDTIYLWSGSVASDVMVWMNGIYYGSRSLTADAAFVVHGSDGNDQIFATDLRRPVAIYGEDGHDLITGGSADDLLEGGAGIDRIHGNGGSDSVRGGDSNDCLFGGDGDDAIFGGAGNDYLDGSAGRDMLVGEQGQDYLKGGDGDDTLAGGFMATGGSHSGSQSSDAGNFTDDGSEDTLCGGAGTDLVFAAIDDLLHSDLDDLFAAM